MKGIKLMFQLMERCDGQGGGDGHRGVWEGLIAVMKCDSHCEVSHLVERCDDHKEM